MLPGERTVRNYPLTDDREACYNRFNVEPCGEFCSDGLHDRQDLHLTHRFVAPSSLEGGFQVVTGM